MTARQCSLLMRLFPALLALVLLAQAGPAAAQNTEFEKAARDLEKALKSGKKPKASPELLRAQRRWAATQRRIDREVARQDVAIRKGGDALISCVREYEERAGLTAGAVDHYLAGRIHGRLANLPKAREHFEAAVRLDPLFFWGYQGLGTYYAMRKMWEPAVRHYQEALRLNGEYVPALRGLATCQVSSNQMEAARKTLEALLERRPEDVDAIDAMGRLLFNELRWEQAATRFEKVLRLAPDRNDVRLNLARCYERTDRSDKAIEVLEDLVKRNPSDWIALRSIARIWNRRGHMHKAADYLAKALKALPPEAPVDAEELEKQIARMRTGPAVIKGSDPRKSPEEWVNILLTSADKERRHMAARVIYHSPRNEPIFNRAFFQIIAKDHEDPVLLSHALAWIRAWWPRSELANPKMLRVFRTLMKMKKEPRVLSHLAWLMGESGSPAAVPTLVETLPSVNDATAFLALHRALNRLTFAYIDVSLPWKLDFADLDRIKKSWADWYAKHRREYRRYEEARQGG